MEDSSVILIGAGLVTMAVALGILMLRKSSSSSPTGSDDGPPKEAFPGGPLTIYFGSQTGTAEGFARTLMDEGRERGFDSKTVDLEDFDAEELRECPLAIFLMATYGEGEPTDNASTFASWLQNESGELERDHLDNTNFAVFGLGNRQYEHYNRQGKLTNKFLATLGAKRVADYGEGDDDGTLEEDFENWKEKFWTTIVARFNPDAANTDNADAAHGPKKITLNFRTKQSSGKAKVPPSSQMNSSTKHFYTAATVTVLTNKELRPGSKEAGSTRHVELDLGRSGITYETADNLAVLPENAAAVVEALAKNQGYDLNTVVECEAAPTATQPFKHLFPTPCSVRDILTKYLDLSGHIRHGAAHHLLAYVQDAKQRDWLENLLSKDKRSVFKANIEERALGFADLLCGAGELSSAKVPLDDLLHIVPFLQPRYYTISSSSSLHPTTVHITVSVTEYPVEGVSSITGKTRVFAGVCSTYLKEAEKKSKIRVFVRPSTFRLPASLSVPIIMVGPGTGIAPMRALLQEREFRARDDTSATKGAGKNTLYFGCREREVDYIYRDELEAYEKSGTLSKLHLAFSRQHRGQKVYVQNLLESPLNASDVHQDVALGAYIYVCGATAMGTDVMECFAKLFQEHYHITKDQATDMIKDLQKKGRYVQELWTA